MITARRGSEVMHFMENDQGHAWAAAYQGGGWDLYTDDGELIPRPVYEIREPLFTAFFKVRNGKMVGTGDL